MSPVSQALQKERDPQSWAGSVSDEPGLKHPVVDPIALISGLLGPSFMKALMEEGTSGLPENVALLYREKPDWMNPSSALETPHGKGMPPLEDPLAWVTHPKLEGKYGGMAASYGPWIKSMLKLMRSSGEKN